MKPLVTRGTIELEPIFVTGGLGLRGYAVRSQDEAEANTMASAVHSSGRQRRAEAARAFGVARRGRQHLLLFVDVLPLDLLDGDLFDRAAPLTRVAAQVVLQLRGTGLPTMVPDLLARVHSLRALGFRFAVADLYGGPARLALLMDLTPEFVKLDAALVSGEEDDVSHFAQASLTLCRRIGAVMIAEGVRSTALVAALARAGCPLLQSARPADVETVSVPTREESGEWPIARLPGR